MNYGNIGYLDHRLNFDLPSDVLRPIGISRASTVFGITYQRDEHEHIFDLMLTPIPPWGWDRSIRVTLRTKHQPKVYERISQTIKQSGCTIVQCEASRTGFRYDTWNLTVVPSFETKTTDWDETAYVYAPISVIAEKLNSAISGECEKLLFPSDEASHHHGPITVTPNSALAFFHHYCEKSGKNPFSLIAYSKYRLAPNGDSLHAALADLAPEKSRGVEYFCPSFVFAEMDTKDVNIRAVLLPRAHEFTQRFYAVQLNWHTTSTKNIEPKRQKVEAASRTIGILNQVTTTFPSSWNIWRMNQKTMSSGPRTEFGRLNFLVEVGPGETIDRVRKAESLNGKLKVEYENILSEFQIRPIDDLHRQMVSATDTDIGNAHQIVISCSGQKDKCGEDLEAYLQSLGYDAKLLFEEPIPGQFFNDNICEAIKRAVLIFVLIEPEMELPAHALGVRDEVMFAYALNKPVVPVMLSTDETQDFQKIMPPYMPSNTLGMIIDIGKPGDQKTISRIEQALYAASRPTSFKQFSNLDLI
ncbi:MAG: hypothetical protein AAF412_02235 [Pseudomonadota bacterium]